MEWFNFLIGGTESYLAQGGAIMGILIVASVVGLAIVLEKLIRLRSSAVFVPELGDRALAGIKNRDDEQVKAVLREAPLPMQEMIEAAGEVQDLPKEEMLSEMSAVASAHIRRLSKRLKLLGILASIAPLLGLLGTVLGMIQAMDEVTLGAAADPEVVGHGISQALVTTAVGLAVGIPLLFMHRLLTGRINRYASTLEEFGHEIMKAFHYPGTISESAVRDTDDGPSLHSLEDEPEPAVP